MLTECGFEVQRLTYTNFSLFPLMFFVRTTQRLLGLPSPEEAGSDVRVPPSVVNEALAGLLRLEARCLRITDLPIGSSLLCLARKPIG